MKVQEAIQTIETLEGRKFLRRETRYNPVRGRKTTFYVFDQGEFPCATWLRYYAERAAQNNTVN